MRDTLERDLAVTQELGRMAGDRIIELEAMLRWFPIDDAPRDGRSFLVGVGDKEMISVAFFMDGHLVIIGGHYQPTHYRPLPEPPKGLRG